MLRVYRCEYYSNAVQTTCLPMFEVMCTIGCVYVRIRCVAKIIEKNEKTSILKFDHLLVFFFVFCNSQYLEENVHQTYVDVGVMARHLQEKYREYTRRKSQPFRYLVDQGKRQSIRHSIPKTGKFPFNTTLPRIA